jgi:FMN phosphatase YigB (HAD superfamily)
MYDLIIFDFDGTFYRQPNVPFAESNFWKEICQASTDLLSTRCGLAPRQAEERFRELSKAYKGELSKAFEVEQGIPLMEYFAQTWGEIDPKKHITKERMDKTTLEKILGITKEIAILSAAPRVWVNKGIEDLGLSAYFTDNVWTGEGVIRKPMPESYAMILSHFQARPEHTLMAGDENDKDIIPAKNMGLTTVHINPYHKQSNAHYCIHSIHELIKVVS